MIEVKSILYNSFSIYLKFINTINFLMKICIFIFFLYIVKCDNFTYHYLDYTDVLNQINHYE